MTEALRIGILGTARIAGAAAVGPAHATGDRLVAVGAGIRDPGPGTRSERLLRPGTPASRRARLPVSQTVTSG